MRFSIISFTKAGMALSQRLAKCLQAEDAQECKESGAWECELYTKCSRYSDDSAEQRVPISYVEEECAKWAGEQMRNQRVLLFIGACGIAVRAIAPHITNKLSDAPVLVMDEQGRHVIPLLAGHVGGANRAAKFLEERMGAAAVITTATDLNHEFAVDTFAVKNHLYIENKEGIAKVSAKILAGETIRIGVEAGHLDAGSTLPKKVRLAGSAEAADVLILRPKEYVIGMGCRKGVGAEKLERFAKRVLKAAGIEMQQVAALASIDVKRGEKGMIALCEKQRLRFLTYSAERLMEVQGSISASSFVKEKVGADNVCERAALCACGEGGILVVRKQAEDGMTIAVAKRRWRVRFDEA